MSIIKATVTNKTAGTIYVVLSAICFALAGVLIKALPWSSLTINGLRSFFAFCVMLVYMKLIGHRFRITPAVVLGAICCSLMTVTFITSTQMTTAANAIILQFVHPVFVIFLSWIFFRNRPQRDAIITCVFVFIGIIFFFFDKISPGNMFGNILGLVSGLFYAVMFLLKKMDGGDFESSLILSYIISFVIGIPFCIQETVWTSGLIITIIAAGIFQNAFAYIFLSRGLDAVAPVTASLTSGIEPILNPLLVAIFFGEMIGPMALIGSVIVILSISVYSLIQIRKDGV